MSTVVDRETLLSDLSQDALSICQQLYPAGVLFGKDFRIGNPDGDAGSSMSITVKGPYAGTFIDFAAIDPALEKGHIIRLIKHKMGLRNMLEVAKWFYNEDVRMKREEVVRAQMFAKPEFVPLGLSRDRDTFSEKIFNEAQAELKGTPVAHYLLCRGISRVDGLHTRDVMSDIRYAPDLYYKDKDCPGGTTMHGLVGAMRNTQGEICGLLRIYLSSTGTKADVLESKKTLGNSAGCGLYMGDPTETVIVGEGFENTRAFQSTMTKKYQAISTLTTSGMKNLVLPDYVKRVIVACDNDENWAGLFAADRMIQNHKDRDIEFFPTIPFKDDWADEVKVQAKHHVHAMICEQVKEQISYRACA